MKQYASSPRKDKSRHEIKRERLEGIAEDTSSAPRLASISAVLFPWRNECLGIHVSPIAQEKREDSSARSTRDIKVR